MALPKLSAGDKVIDNKTGRPGEVVGGKPLECVEIKYTDSEGGKISRFIGNLTKIGSK